MKKIFASIILLTFTLFAFGDNIPSGVLNVGKQATAGLVRIFNGGSLKLRELNSNGSDEVTFKAANSSASYTMTLPASAGSSGQVLSNTGSATLDWASAATVPSTAGGVYSDGTALQSVAFSGNANKVFGVNSGATSMEAKSILTGSTAVSNDVGISHAAGSITIQVPSASTSDRGVVTTGVQDLGGTSGLKRFPGGMAQAGDTSSTTSAASGSPVVIAATDKRQRTFTNTFTNDVYLRLPTGTTIYKGDTFRFDVTSSNVASTFDLIVRANDDTDIGSDVNHLASGYIVARAKQDNPTTGTHWEISDVVETRKVTASATFNNGTTTNASWIVKYGRVMDKVTINIVISAVGQPSTGTSTRLDTGVVVPVRFRVIDSPHQVISKTRQTGADLNVPGAYVFQTDGTIRFTYDIAGTGTWGSAANSGSSGNVTVTYNTTAN